MTSEVIILIQKYSWVTKVYIVTLDVQNCQQVLAPTPVSLQLIYNIPDSLSPKFNPKSHNPISLVSILIYLFKRTILFNWRLVYNNNVSKKIESSSQQLLQIKSVIKVRFSNPVWTASVYWIHSNKHYTQFEILVSPNRNANCNICCIIHYSQ